MVVGSLCEKVVVGKDVLGYFEAHTGPHFKCQRMLIIVMGFMRNCANASVDYEWYDQLVARLCGFAFLSTTFNEVVL